MFWPSYNKKWSADLLSIKKEIEATFLKIPYQEEIGELTA